MCMCEKRDACTSHAASLCTLQTFARPRASLVRERPTKLCVDNADGAFRAQHLARLCNAQKKEREKKRKKNADRPAFQRNRLRRFSFVLMLRRGLHQSAYNRREDVCETPLSRNLSSERETARGGERENNLYTRHRNDIFYVPERFPRYEIQISNTFVT